MAKIHVSKTRSIRCCVCEWNVTLTNTTDDEDARGLRMKHMRETKHPVADQVLYIPEVRHGDKTKPA